MAPKATRTTGARSPRSMTTSRQRQQPGRQMAERRAIRERRHADGHPGHMTFDRFPTRDELRRVHAEAGIAPTFSAEVLWRRFKRHVDTLADLHGSAVAQAGNFLPASRMEKALLQPWFAAVLATLFRGRADHRTLSTQARQQFNQALQDAHADGSYQALAAVHSNMSHNMHSMMGPVGTQRFLPWHRIFTLKMEDVLRAKQPDLTIPYWNCAEDQARPDWVWQPPQVTRHPPGVAGGSLPSPALVNDLVNNTPDYTDFTQGIEFDAHNGVHNWCNGTISDPATATQDPIFWLLHANVDRMWDAWQLNHSGTPSLTGFDSVMDPWTQKATDANDIVRLGYAYK